jgi:hypothetical protein
MRLCKLLVPLIGVASMCFQVCIAAPQGRIYLDMTNLGKAWDEYTTNPNKDTALKLYELLPPGKGPQEVELQVDVRDNIFSKLNILESQIYSGERNALKVAFRLFGIADGEMKKALVKIIGYLLRFDTKLFLEELLIHETLVPDLGQLVCSFQLASPDDKAHQELERNIRLKSLGYIEDKELKDIKKKCIKILKDLKIQ